MPILSVTDLKKTIAGKVLFSGLNFSLEAGELLLLLGASGSGKTTLLRILAGLTLYDSGSIDSVVQYERIGYIQQKPVLFSHMTVLENVAFPLKCQKIKRKEREKRAAVFLQRIGLGDFMDRFPYELSGGQQQRISIARAFIADPQLILMDEPFSHLDAELSRKIQDWTMNLIRKQHLAAILVTHHYEEVKRLNSRTMILQDGCLHVGTGAAIEAFFGLSRKWQGKNVPLSQWRLSQRGIPVKVCSQITLYGTKQWLVETADGSRCFIAAERDENLPVPAFIAPLEGGD
ncbi:ABC transporter ATP-binding protein [Bacillaceae bacterium Marseille-Q3522]|nr:ABC transporter ATP-binding protein [Bacillaceae bacterium Marseille-Q3522]